MKRGGPIRRRAGLARGAPLKRTGLSRKMVKAHEFGAPGLRRTPLRPVNPKRRARARAEAFGPQAELCRTLPCCACNAPPPSDPHHEPTRGAGGKDRDTVPLCRSCHDRVHIHGLRAFEKGSGVSLVDVAAQLSKRSE